MSLLPFGTARPPNTQKLQGVTDARRFYDTEQKLRLLGLPVALTLTRSAIWRGCVTDRPTRLSASRNWRHSRSESELDILAPLAPRRTDK